MRQDGNAALDSPSLDETVNVEVIALRSPKDQRVAYGVALVELVLMGRDEDFRTSGNDRPSGDNPIVNYPAPCLRITNERFAAVHICLTAAADMRIVWHHQRIEPMI
jgi:hypothetical protein